MLSLELALAKFPRRGTDLDTYWFAQHGLNTQPYQFVVGSVFNLMEPDLNQEIYGLPEYLSAIPSTLLDESATLSRRKYYLNGSHAGFIMYMTDTAQNLEGVDNILKAMKSCEGSRELPQPVHVLAEREERRVSDHPAIRGGD